MQACGHAPCAVSFRGEKARSSGAAAGSSSTLLEAPLLQPPPAPPPDSPPEGRRRKVGARVGKWVHIKLDGIGELVFEKATGKVNAHCLSPAHCSPGVTCHMDRRTKFEPGHRLRHGEGRPLGYLVAWLLQLDHATKRSHQDAKPALGRAGGHPARRDARAHLRELSHRIPEVEELFGMERPASAEETALGGEPLIVP